MKKKPLRTTEQEFNELFLASVDEALSSLGEGAKTAIYFHLEQKFHIKKQEIPYCLNSFAEALDTLFGPGCKPLELMLMQKLYAKVKGKCGPIKPEDFTFPKYVNMVKQNMFSNNKKEKKANHVSECKHNGQIEKDNRFATLLNFMADPVVIVDEKGRFLVLNAAFEELTGLSKKEAIGTSFLEMSIISKESKSILLENLRKRITGVSVEPYEITFSDKIGETRYLEVKARKIDYSGQPADLVIFRDITRRKSNERRLKEYSEKLETLVDAKAREISESAEKLKGIFNSSPDAIIVTNSDLIIVECNQAAIEMGGLSSKAELIGKSGFSFLGEGAVNRVQEVWNLLHKYGVARNIEYAFSAKDGRKITCEFSVSAIKDSSGKVTGFVTITKDITERKKAEEQLLSSEKKYRELFEDLKRAEAHLLQERDRAQDYLDVASVMLVALDTEGRVTILNRKGCTILGCTSEEALGKNWFDNFLPKNENDKVKRVFQSLTAEKTTFPEYHENYVLSKNGEKRLIAWHNTLLKNSEGQITGTLSSGEDVTEKKKMEAAIKADLDMLEALTEGVGVGFVTISKDYRVLWANRFVKNNVGDVEGKQCYATLNTLDHICPDCGVKKVFEDGVAKDSHEYSQNGIDGKPYYVELIATPLKDKDGNVTAALECVVDIAEKKRMQIKLMEYSQKLEKLVEERTEQLQQTQAKLVKSERLAAIGELAGMVGHDLRNPLTSIKGAAYFLKAKYSKGLDTTGKMMLSTIDNSIDYSNKIINDLLDYSRDIKLELSGTTPKSLLKNTFALIEVPENIKIADETEDTPKFKADTGKMRRVFVNIIKNAFDAMPQGGTFTITSREVKGSVEIVFEDTGIGMNQETLNKLWTPLFTTKAKGMGFGLPICKRIVEAHGGRIFVESASGIGTTFTVTIPVDPKPATETEEPWVFNSPVESVIATT